MDIQPQATTQPISDDQELAKALAGVMPDAPSTTPPTPAANPMQFEETPAPAPAVAPATITPSPSANPAAPTASTTSTGDLGGIKKDALGELRPLIDKVELPPEEKFDTYLMLIRSTDDSSLIAPAHAAAQAISDEKRRAEALLDIIKEIDYLSHGKAAA
jgi:hypothetical protein